jgi:hypothetical protein
MPASTSCSATSNRPVPTWVRQSVRYRTRSTSRRAQHQVEHTKAAVAEQVRDLNARARSNRGVLVAAAVAGVVAIGIFIRMRLR